MDAATKARLIDEFAAYLEQLTEPAEESGNDRGDESGQEPTGDGEPRDPWGQPAPVANDQRAPVEPAPDLFTLLAELGGLRNEVKLESRQVKAALEEFRALFETLDTANTRLAEEQTRRREQERLDAQSQQRTLLLELLELRDRLDAGAVQAAGFRPGWFAARRTRTWLTAMTAGMDMNLRRLDETLARLGVRPLPAIGQPFDPHRMHATEVAANPDRADGEVLAELRKGFLLGDALLRPAEVVVNRRDGG